jgi:putative endonuclease
MRHHTRPHPLDDHAATPLGRRGEDLTAVHLEADDGLEVVARNWRLATGELRGELDVVALDHARGLVVVVEVKARRSDAHGGPLVAVTVRKQHRVRQLTAALLPSAGLPYGRVRFDVVGLWLPDRRAGRLEHLEGAF